MQLGPPTLPAPHSADADVRFRSSGAATPQALAQTRSALADYLRLDANLTALYTQWGAADANFARHADAFRGIRLLRQDPVENVFTFICSSCNNIARIAQMVDKLCAHFGVPVAPGPDGRMYHAFPTVERLAQPDVEAQLRALGFGYRARFIQQAAQLVRHHPPGWLASLRRQPYAEARAALLTLPGVGPKVADCICLMSLVCGRWRNAVSAGHR